jgi:hypothetical protein
MSLGYMALGMIMQKINDNNSLRDHKQVLKRKGISDTTASERMASAGHRSPEMMKVYDVKPDLVKPTKN